MGNWARSIGSDAFRVALTAMIGLTAGWGLKALGAPAPYMLGSLFGVWFFGALLPKSQAYLGTPRWFHKVIVLGLATLIGGTFSIEVMQQIINWWPTVIAMIIATLIATLAGLAYLIGVRRQPLAQALLSALPGGQADIVAVARDYCEKDYLAALVHLCRVVAVFVSMPLLLAWNTGPEGVQQSYTVQEALPGLTSLHWTILLQLIGVGLIGFGLARVLRIPMPHLLGPLMLSIALHLLGWIDIPRISEFVLVAQLFIAGTIGARLSRVAVREVLVGLTDGLVTAIILIGTFILIAFIGGRLFGLDQIELILAFIPGGLYEVTLLALIFGFDLAFVALHHTVRILIIFFALPWLMGWAAHRD